MDPAEKELIRARTDIVELISSYTALKKAGSRYKGLCPFHNEKTPSFNVDPERGRWTCFGACSTGGDVFTFLEKAENLTFIEAAERLATRAGIVLSGKGNPEEARRSQSERDRLFAANAAAAHFFREAYQRSSLAQEYAARRGLVHETREAFAIGFAPDDWGQLADYLIGQKIHPDDAVKAGLISPSRRGDGTFIDRFRGRLIFPIADVQERVVGFGGRLIVDKPDAPKYLNSPETPVFSKSKTLYALNRAKRAIADRGLAVVVEGYMDAVAAHQAGLAFVVATLGTALTDDHARLLRRYAGENKTVILSFDADTAGVRAALRAAELIAGSASDLVLRVLSLPPGEDPDSLIRKGDVAGFHRAIDAALTVPEFRLRTLAGQHDVRTPAGNIAFWQEATPVIGEVNSPLEENRLIQMVESYHPTFSGGGSLRAGETIRAEVRKYRQSKRGAQADYYSDDPLGPVTTPHRKGERPQTGYYRDSRPALLANNSPSPSLPAAAEVAERTLLRALLSEEWFRAAQRRLGGYAEKLPYSNPLTLPLLRALCPLLSGKISPRNAAAQLIDPQLIGYVDVLLMDGSEMELSEQAIEDAVDFLAVRRTEMAAREAVHGGAGVTDEQLLAWKASKRLNPKKALFSDDSEG